jgi:hypothetical protein
MYIIQNEYIYMYFIQHCFTSAAHQLPLCRRMLGSSSEPVVVNVSGAQELILRNRFRQPVKPAAGRYDKSGCRTVPRLGIDSWAP